MKDYQAHLEKLRTDAAECALIRDLATDARKRELLLQLALPRLNGADGAVHLLSDRWCFHPRGQ
jgi:hypothetical protein